MTAIQLKNLLGLAAAGVCLAAIAGCIGTASTTGNDGAQLATQTKGTAADSAKVDTVCGHHERDTQDSLVVKGTKDDPDSAEVKDKTEIGRKGCDEGDHHGAIGGHEDKDNQEVGNGDREAIDGGMTGEIHETETTA